MSENDSSFAEDFITPPCDKFVSNPFDSPLMNRLLRPMCSPNLFDKSSKGSSSEWSNSDSMLLRSVDIDTTNSFKDESKDPEVEAAIQSKITRFFRQSSIVPTPDNIREENKQDISVRLRKLTEGLPKLQIDNKPSNSEEFKKEESEERYVPEDIYEQMLFPSTSKIPESTPNTSPAHSPLNLTPVKFTTKEGFSDEMVIHGFTNLSLSPISKQDICSLSYAVVEKQLSPIKCVRFLPAKTLKKKPRLRRRKY